MSLDDDYDETPPAGEEIHLPGPSVLPLLSAIAITMMVIGTTVAWWISIVGLVLFVVTTVMWVRDTSRSIDELPEEHGH